MGNCHEYAKRCVTKCLKCHFKHWTNKLYSTQEFIRIKCVSQDSGLISLQGVNCQNLIAFTSFIKTYLFQHTMHLYNYRYPNGCKVSTYLSLIVVPNYWVGVSPCPRSQQCNVHNVSKYSTGSLGTETIDPGRIPRILDHTVALEVIKFDIDTWGKRPLWWLLICQPLLFF